MLCNKCRVVLNEYQARVREYGEAVRHHRECVLNAWKDRIETARYQAREAHGRARRAYSECNGHRMTAHGDAPFQ